MNKQKKNDTKTPKHGLSHGRLIYRKEQAEQDFGVILCEWSTKTWCAAGASVWPVIVYHAEFLIIILFFFLSYDWMRHCARMALGGSVYIGFMRVCNHNQRHGMHSTHICSNWKLIVRCWWIMTKCRFDSMRQSAKCSQHSENKFAMIELRHNLKWCNTITV